MLTSLQHKDAEVLIEPLLDGRKLVKVESRKAGMFVPYNEWTTSYPTELIELILSIKGPAYLCDEMMRDENLAYVQEELTRDLFAYFDAADFANTRILDFGCGSGASTAILARTFPTAEIVGIDLCEDLLAVARERMKFHRFGNISLRQSPAGTELPEGIGEFDFVIMSAVYEHLLPDERKTLMPKIWAVVSQGGYLFINQTPNLMCPIEGHTTGLPLLNYIPQPFALPIARKLSRRIEREDSWASLLRQGIRGATEREIVRNLGGAKEDRAVLMEPHKNGFHDRVDLWYSALNHTRMTTVKRGLRVVMKVMWHGMGVTLMPNLTLIIQKQPARSRGA